jgi:hypothetical protein
MQVKPSMRTSKTLPARNYYRYLRPLYAIGDSLVNWLASLQHIKMNLPRQVRSFSILRFGEPDMLTGLL